MVIRGILVLWMAVLPILPSAILAQEAPPQRLAEPAVEAQRESEKLIREVFKEEYARKSAADQKILARKLLQQGIDTRDDPTARYVLFGEAREISEKGGDVETALTAIAETAKYYEIDGPALKAKTLIEMAAGTKSPEAASALVDACLEVIDEAVREEKFDVARSLVAKAEAAAKAAKDLKKVVQVQKKGKEIEELSKESQKAKEAEKALEANPADPEASLVFGRHLLLKGEVEKALGMLAKGSDALLRAAAEKDIATGSTPADQAAAGDAWWEAAEKEKSLAMKAVILGRARKKYEKALPGLTGFAKVKVQKRVESIGAPASSKGSAVELITPKGVSGENILEKMLGRVSSRDSSKEDGSVFTLRSGDRISTEESFRPPVDFYVIAQTDSMDIRIAHAADQMIFNWKFNPNEFRIDGGPASGRHRLGAGRIPTNQWVTFYIQLTVTRLSVWVDGKMVYETQADFSQIDRSLSLWPGHGSTVKVKWVSAVKAKE